MPNICNLNRKPYRDKEGLLRVRTDCCGRKANGCSLTKQPEGKVIRHRPAKNLSRVSKHENEGNHEHQSS